MTLGNEPQLLANGLDFINHAVESLRGEPDAKALKLAIIYLDAGVELVLKERLIREHWTLVFRRPGAARREEFQSGDFQSASFDECIDRLIHIVGWSIQDKERRKLKQFRRKRNALMHFGFLDEPGAVLAGAASTLSFLVDFVNEHFRGTSLGCREEALLRGIRQGLAEFERFVQSRWSQIQGEVDAAGAVVSYCDSCGQRAVIGEQPSKDPTNYECKFCGHCCTAKDAADAFIFGELGIDHYTCVKDGGEWPVTWCSECLQELLVDRGGSGDVRPHEQFICFGCGETWMEGGLYCCVKCGQLFDPGDDTMSVCDDCFQMAVRDPKS